MRQKTAIPFVPFEDNRLNDPARLHTLRNLSIPVPSQEAEVEGACLDSTSLTETAAHTPASEKQSAGHPPPPLPDRELVPDLPLEQPFPHSQASSPALLLLSHPRLPSFDRVRTPAAPDARFPVLDGEEFLTVMGTPSHPLQQPPVALDSHRFKPYRVPETRAGSGFHRQIPVVSATVPDREVVHRMASSRTRIDRGRHQPRGQQEPQTIMSDLDLAWASGGTMTVPSANHPSLSMRRPSAPPEVGSGDSQNLMREMERIVPSLDHSRGDSLSWNSVSPKTVLQSDLNPRQDQEGFYSHPSERGMYTPQVAVDLERAALDSLFGGLQALPSETEIQGHPQVHRQRALSYSQELRMQQEEQLRKLRERVQDQQLSIVQTQTPPLLPQSPPHPDRPQHRPHSLPIPSGFPLLDPSGHPALPARPQSRVDGNIVLDHMNLNTGIPDMGTGATSRRQSSLPAQIYRREVPPQQARAHHYPQEVHPPQAPSPQQVSMLGGDRVIPMTFEDGIGMNMGIAASGNSNAYPYPDNFSFGLLPSGALGIGDGVSSNSGFNHANNGGNADVGN